MKATFWYVVRYTVKARCLSPLRTGGTDGDTETVLTGPDGVHFIQGSSFAGAFRGWLEAGKAQPALIEELFGSQMMGGSLIFSDGRFEPDVQVSIRPRLKIDPRTGCVNKRKKFDLAKIDDGDYFHLAQINGGACFHFELIWQGEEDDTEQQRAVEAMLAAMNAGQICLGAQKSNGFGRVSLTVRCQRYDMHDPADRAAWLEGVDRSQLLALPENGPDRRVRFVVKGSVDGLLVKSSVALLKGNGAKGSYTPNLTEDGAAVVPGSSIKGAVRAQAERIADAAKLPAGTVDALFGCGEDGGNQGRAGRVRVEDLRLEQAKKKQITRIRINRFTGGVIRQGLMVEEPLSTPVRLELSITDGSDMEYALLLYALRDLGLGLYNLGSGGSIGRGYVSVSEITMTDSAGKQATLHFGQDGQRRLEDPAGFVAAWMQAWKEARQG